MWKFPAWVDIAVENMNRGIRNGNTSPQAAMKKVPAQLKPLFETVADSGIFFKPILAMPDSFSLADREKLTTEYSTTIASQSATACQRSHQPSAIK